MSRSSLLPALIIALGFVASAARAATPTPTLTPDQLLPGQKATVKTVFEGQRIEEFQAEIVGVLKGGATEGDIILARATEDRLKRVGIAQGMSGSPVYVDGKLVGALSGGWSFTREPLFVVTPIGEMLGTLPPGKAGEEDLSGTSAMGGFDAGGGAAGRDAATGFGPYRWGGGEAAEPTPEPERRVADAASLATPAPLAIPLACAGLDRSLLPLATRLFAPLGLTAVPGGATAPATTTFEPGSAVAVELMRGDLRMAAIGTVTWREGDRVLIFGHPFFQAGPIRLPLASASITTIVASDLTSFKLGSAGAAVGTATQDRRAAVAGSLGATPRLLPFAVTIAGGERPAQSFHFESIEDRSLAPQLLSLAAVNGLLESGGTTAGQTARWTLTLHRKGSPPLTLSDVVVSESPVTDLQAAIAAPLRFLYGNPYARLALDSVSARIETSPARRLWSLRAARLVTPTVRPGGIVRVTCDLERWRGATESIDFALRMPEEAPPGKYTVWIGGGPELSRHEAARLPGRYRPSSLDEAWTRLAAYRPSDRLHLALLARAPEVTRDGRDYPELPLSALALLAGSQEAEPGSRVGNEAVLDRTDRAFEGQVRGEIQLEVEVDRTAP